MLHIIHWSESLLSHPDFVRMGHPFSWLSGEKQILRSAQNDTFPPSLSGSLFLICQEGMIVTAWNHMDFTRLLAQLQ
jgi:hypothetical protein